MQALLIWILIMLPFLNGSQHDIMRFSISGYAQGTTYQITYYAEKAVLSKEETENILREIDHSLSIYQTNSLISNFNKSASGVPVDSHFVSVVKKALGIFHETDGLFDITVKPLVQAWGFGVKPGTEIPDSSLIRRLRGCVGSRYLRLKNGQLFKSKPCVEIDVNGIAQGYTVDVIADLLEERDARGYVVELGGEIRVRGTKPSGEYMSVGIESPPEEAAGLPVQRIIHLPRGAVTTSGTYQRYRRNGNRIISHLIDPRNGYPVENELISVTVIADDAITADGYDNALMAMGLKGAMNFVKRHNNLHAYFIYHKSDGSVADTASAGFYHYLK